MRCFMDGVILKVQYSDFSTTPAHSPVFMVGRGGGRERALEEATERMPGEESRRVRVEIEERG